jgi:hypothetical protein
MSCELAVTLGLPPLRGPNPFLNTCSLLSPLEKLRLWSLGLVLVPLRMVVVVLALGLAAWFSWVGTLGLTDQDTAEGNAAWPLWRRACTGTVPFFSRVYVVWLVACFVVTRTHDP